MAIQILYFSTAVSFKTSLVLLYHRIFGVVRWYRYVLAAAEGIVACYFIVCMFVAVFECNPVSFYWDKEIPHGACINQTQFYRWNGVANLLIDLMILCLTFPMVWRLKIGTRQKITLLSIFLLGALYVELAVPAKDYRELTETDSVFIASIIRVVMFKELKLEDETYTNVEPAIWTVVEQSLGITCACLPTLRPLFGRLLFGTSHARSSTGANCTVRSGELNMSKLSNKPLPPKPRDEEIRRDFEHPSDENVASVTTHASVGSTDDLVNLVPKAILKSHTIQQRYDQASLV